MRLRRLLQEPLLHFLAATGILFGVFGLTHRAGPVLASNKTIVVDGKTLLNFLQYRSKAFKPEFFSSQLEAMTPAERKDLVNQYVEEEILYREAKAMELEQGDYVIRQRLVQKMRFLIEGMAEGSAKPSDAALAEYLQKNMVRYVVDPSVTFTHVFFDSSVHGDRQARELALRLKDNLNASGAVFSDAPKYGDRFPFLQNYVERKFDYVASQFGNEFVSGLKQNAPSEEHWIGPIRSTYGYHVVLMTRLTEARVPALNEIRSQVADDWLRDQIEDERSRAMNQLVSRYKIVEKDLGGPIPK
jgi:PPIC-type PPIASE domain